MYLAIYSNELKIGMGLTDKTVIIKNAFNLDEATEIADNYAEENNIKYAIMDVIDLNDCERI